MSTPWLNLMMDGLVALLLLGAIPSFWILSRRLKSMQMGQDGMRQLIEGLNIATEQARRAITDMKLAAAHASQEMDMQIKAGRQMADELALMVDAGNNLASRLESGIAGGRLQPASQMSPVQPPRKAPSIDAGFEEEFVDDSSIQSRQPRGLSTSAGNIGSKAEAESDLMKALKSIR